MDNQQACRDLYSLKNEVIEKNREQANEGINKLRKSKSRIKKSRTCSKGEREALNNHE
jgi:hypothetical protein